MSRRNSAILAIAVLFGFIASAFAGSITLAPVPESGTAILLLGLGLAAVDLVRRKLNK
jgi:hypothetical protein